MMAPGFDWGWPDLRRIISKSSFAPALLLMDASSRRDLQVYYAFCRAVDDSADDFPPEEGAAYLGRWLQVLQAEPAAGEPLLVSELRRVCRERAIPKALLVELIQGAQSDLRPRVEFASRDELYAYCHQVAGVVGQASLPIFGLDASSGMAYAETLGRAFQLINIVRDAKEDQQRGRNYFALEDLSALGGPQAVAEAYAGIAGQCLKDADALAGQLPQRPLRPSRLMRALYGALLEAMLEDHVRVFQRRYRLSPLRKAWIILKGFAA
jgi:phytoene/squalene synthetase